MTATATRGNVHVEDVMKEITVKFARTVAKHSHITGSYDYLSHVDKQERIRRDAVRFASERLSDEREWDLVLSLCDRYGVNLADAGLST